MEGEDKFTFEQLFRRTFVRTKMRYAMAKPTVPKPRYESRLNNQVTVICGEGSMHPTVYGICIPKQGPDSHVLVSDVLAATAKVDPI